VTRRAVAAALGLFALIAAVACHHSPAVNRAAVVRYQQAILPYVQEWGRIEILGMRPAVADLQSGNGVPAAAIATEADAWTAGLGEIRDQLHAIQTPPELRPAASLFDRAIVQYLAAAQLFGEAARATPADRPSLIATGRADVHAGTRLYNQAALVLQSVRHRAGLPKSPDFPDHPAA
jgi:hypothetical protein